MELADMNEDCLEYLVKFCDADSMVAVSQTCNKLNGIAVRFFHLQTSYDCQIESKEDETRVKRTIGAIGKYLTELDFRTRHNWDLSNEFIARLSQKCPNLQKLEIRSRVSPNIIFGSVQTIQHLEHLTIHCWDEDSDDVAGSVIELKQLQLLRVFGSEWNHNVVIAFIREAANLKDFGFDIDHPHRHSHYEIGNVFLEELKSLCIVDPDELTFFLVRIRNMFSVGPF